MYLNLVYVCIDRFRRFSKCVSLLRWLRGRCKESVERGRIVRGEEVAAKSSCTSEEAKISANLFRASQASCCRAAYPNGHHRQLQVFQPTLETEDSRTYPLESSSRHNSSSLRYIGSGSGTFCIVASRSSACQEMWLSIDTKGCLVSNSLGGCQAHRASN